MSETQRPAKTPAQMLAGVRQVENLEVLHAKQSMNFKALKKGLQWGVFRPAQFDARGSWSVRLIGSLSDIKSLGVEVRYPNGSKETISLADLPVELWPLEQLPASYHPRMPGEPYGKCWERKCTNTLARMLNSEDDKFYCEACARKFNFQRPGLCSKPRDLPELPAYGMGRITVMDIQRSINRLGLITLEEFVRRSEKLYQQQQD